MNRTALLVTALVALASLLPGATAADATPGITNPDVPTPVTLYFHINGFQNFPINTQKPSDLANSNEGIGLATNTLTCVPANPATGAATAHKYHTFYGYGSPSYVEYNITENGGPRIHQERGLSYDVEFTPGQPLLLHWYLATTTNVQNIGGVSPDAAPIVLPDVVVRGTVRSRASISVGDEGYNSGIEIAKGESLPTILGAEMTASLNQAAPGHGQVNVTKIGNYYVYDFLVPMTLSSPVVPKADGYNLRVDVFQKVSGCDDSADQFLMPNLVHVWSSPTARPRLEVSITDPIRIEYMHPQFIGDDMVIHTSSNSPWGNYDVDEVADKGTCYTQGGITLTITGPSEARGLCRAAVVQRAHEHDHHTQAVDVSFVWPFRSDGAQDGKYTISMTVQNDQHTATAIGVAQFEIGRGGKDLTVTKCGGLQSVAGADTEQKCIIEKQDNNGNALPTVTKKSPNLELVGIVGVIGLAAVVIRRRTD